MTDKKLSDEMWIAPLDWVATDTPHHGQTKYIRADNIEGLLREALMKISPDDPLYGHIKAYLAATKGRG